MSLEERLRYREAFEQGSAGPGYISGLMKLWSEVLGKPERIVELGTWTGNSTFAWLAVSPHTFVTTVDINHENLLPLHEDVERYDWTGRVSMIKADSIAYAEDFRRYVDVVYIDTTHEYERTCREIEAWLPHLAPRGWIVLDDTVSYPAVLKAFKKYEDKFNWFIGYTDLPYTPKNHGLLVARIK